MWSSSLSVLSYDSAATATTTTTSSSSSSTKGCYSSSSDVSYTSEAEDTMEDLSTLSTRPVFTRPAQSSSSSSSSSKSSSEGSTKRGRERRGKKERVNQSSISPPPPSSSSSSPTREEPVMASSIPTCSKIERSGGSSQTALTETTTTWSEWLWSSTMTTMTTTSSSSSSSCCSSSTLSANASEDADDKGEEEDDEDNLGDGWGAGTYLSSWYDWWYDSKSTTNYIEQVKKRNSSNNSSSAPTNRVDDQIHPNETYELIRESLNDLERILDRIPSTCPSRYAWDEANDKCEPREELVGKKHKLMFLRCEVFNADRAAQRLLRYWTKRVEIFGPDRAYLPLTLNGALKDDFVSLSLGFMTSTERTDNHGRRIIYGDPSKLDSSLYERNGMVRALWYAVHAALEDETTQRKGAILMLNHEHVQPTQFDPDLVRLCAISLRGCIPLRIGSIHLFHLPYFVNYIAPLFKYLLGEKLWSRIVIHDGSDSDAIVSRLGQEYGIRVENVPSDVGGGHELNQTLWLAERNEAGL